MSKDQTALRVQALDYDISDPISIERFAKKLIGRTLRQALKGDRPTAAARDKGEFGSNLERWYFGLPQCNESRPDFVKANLELKASPVRRRESDGRLVPKERISLSMIDYDKVVHEEWETSALLRKNRNILFVFYLYEEKVSSPLDYVVKFVGRWSIPDECMPLLEADWRTIRDVIARHGPGALSGQLTENLEAAKKGAKGTTARRAFAFKPRFVEKYILPRVSWSQPLLPPDADEAVLSTIAPSIAARFNRFLGMTAEEIAEQLGVKSSTRAKSFHADVTKAILGLDPDNAIEDVTVKSIRLDYGRTKPREHMSFPTFSYMDLAEEEWETSDLRQLLMKPFLFVVYREESRGGRRVLTGARLWHMPQSDLEGEVRRIWHETVQQIRSGRADDLPKGCDSPICHVRPHGRDSDDRLPTPANGMLVKKCFWLRNSYVQVHLAEQ